MAKWALELGEFDVGFQPRTTTKSQVLADFIIELTQIVGTPMVNKGKCEVWEMMVDGLSNQIGPGLGIVLKSHHGEIF